MKKQKNEAEYHSKDYQLEVHINKLPKNLYSIFSTVFRHQRELENVFVISTFQHSKFDFVGVGPDVDLEKDRLLMNFLDWANRVRESEEMKRYWIEVMDPSSGLPLYGEYNGNTIITSIELAQSVLKFDVLQVGFCEVILHPKFHTSSYPATIFTTCPYPSLQQILKNIP